jgi:hypothetical protein
VSKSGIPIYRCSIYLRTLFLIGTIFIVANTVGAQRQSTGGAQSLLRDHTSYVVIQKKENLKILFSKKLRSYLKADF